MDFSANAEDPHTKIIWRSWGGSLFMEFLSRALKGPSVLSFEDLRPTMIWIGCCLNSPFLIFQLQVKKGVTKMLELIFCNNLKEFLLLFKRSLGSYGAPIIAQSLGVLVLLITQLFEIKDGSKFFGA